MKENDERKGADGGRRTQALSRIAGMSKKSRGSLVVLVVGAERGEGRGKS
jgi:hypothetical protein